MGAFRDDAQAYCEFVDRWQTTSVQEPFTTLLRLLSNLTKSAASLPFDRAKNDVPDVERIDHARWQQIAGGIKTATGDACAALMNEHAGNDEAMIRASMLWDDLADLYRDLRHGLDLYASGDADHVAEAIWQWRFGYESHWGAHLFRALTSVHEIRFRLFRE